MSQISFFDGSRMTVYLVMGIIGDHKDVYSVWATKEEADKEIKHLRECDLYGKVYYIDSFTVNGDVFSAFPTNKLIQRYQEVTKDYNELREHLKFLASKINTVFKEQPTDCIFGYGTCNYPIEDCSKCPAHYWEFGTECVIK